MGQRVIKWVFLYAEQLDGVDKGVIQVQMRATLTQKRRYYIYEKEIYILTELKLDQAIKGWKNGPYFVSSNQGNKRI